MLIRWLAIIGIIIAAGMAAWFGLPEAKKSVQVGGATVPFTLPDLKGKMHGLPEEGVVLLNFWATWCPPCRKEMPSMAELHRKYAEKGLKVVAVSVDRDADDLSAFVREYRLPFQILHDADSSVSRSYSVFRYPETFLIDRQGKIRHHFVGAVEWMSESVTKRIEGLLNEPGANKAGVEQKG